ncbi:hypothetical protein GMA8713_01888 [Grimontia marina]|uniref:Uncharacterized protein n=1 Tax=Grimontia marina TaxID=646534 RepID=A0A128F5K2_9GAMM|nr:hypothetical protein GMA8713_01888 [Grimontia marina]
MILLPLFYPLDAGKTSSLVLDPIKIVRSQRLWDPISDHPLKKYLSIQPPKA